MSKGAIFFVLGVALLYSLASGRDFGPLNKSLVVDDLPIGYSSAQQALAAVPTSAEIKTSKEVAPAMMEYATGVELKQKWWLFGKGHEFFPAVVRRRVVPEGDGFIVKTAVLCDAGEPACDKLRGVLEQMDRGGQ